MQRLSNIAACPSRDNLLFDTAITPGLILSELHHLG